ncbi:zinc finger FYVE domain-containing protein 1-like [Schistocerca gregaria]|uniref:zinc finger FYVE domain-containing protein 1-like n=1 Tax=Schistocerca gregaria TaxID=7010 RepID=UPI00211E2851|nr:zinc finger FYVE domain-containing protein 1-like [Schistocerca gregaria]
MDVFVNKPSMARQGRRGPLPAIMQSYDSLSETQVVGNTVNHDSIKLYHPGTDGVTITNQFTSLKLGSQNDDNATNGSSFLLIDDQENLQVTSAEQLAGRLGCGPQARLKVVSVLGNAGDGKSHTLNHTFFCGREAFRTSEGQDSCTMGVWAALEPSGTAICLDTEGLLGGSGMDENRRTRLLLKVLAVSDVVIFRTRAERLHRDMLVFLGSASRAYSQHFSAALQAVSGKLRALGGASMPSLGPSVIIFHETRHTRPLQQTLDETPEDVLRTRFAQCGLEMDAFSSLHYVGIQTVNQATDFGPLRFAVRSELDNSSVRSPRPPALVFHTLKVLNEKFSGEMEVQPRTLFPDQYFSCPARCLSCERRCEAGMGHSKEGRPHMSSGRCRFQHQYENCQYICKICYGNGMEVIVTPCLTSTSDTSWFGLAKYAWSGYVIECPNCGEIYRSRQFWYGNKNPEDAAVRTEIRHVWPGGTGGNLIGTQNAARKVLDGVNYISEAVASVGSPPTRLLSSWVTDQIAPRYWKPNNEIKDCSNCHTFFEMGDTKHHCRACGEGVCENCSSHQMEVPERGWHYPVRVCDECYSKAQSEKQQQPQQQQRAPQQQAVSQSAEEEAEVRARKVGEAVISTLSSVAAVLEYPRDLIKESARPSYWQPDGEATGCNCCGATFGPRLSLHHCRDCGRAVCRDCSQSRRPVPIRGWDTPVRVCDSCIKKA